MLKGKTKSGFEFAIPKNTLDNYEIVEAFSEIDENPLVITKLIGMLLGKEQTKALKEHVRNEDGIVLSSVITNEFTEVINSLQEVKK